MLHIKAFWTVLVLLLLILVYVFYPTAPEPVTYRIGRDSSDLGVDLYGKEVNVVAFIDDLLGELKPVAYQPITLGREYLRGELDRGDLDGIYAFGDGEGLPFRGLLGSKTIFPLGPILVVRKDSPINEIIDMKGKSVGVEKNSSLYLALNKIPSFRIVPADTMWSLFEMVLLHRVDGIVIDTLPAYLYLERIHKEDLRFVLPPLTGAGIKLFTRPNPKGEELIANFNTNFEDLHQSHKLEDLLEKWGFGGYPALPFNPPVIPEITIPSTTPSTPQAADFEFLEKR